MKEKLEPNESILKGGWIFDGRQIKPDMVTNRIELLIQEYLERVSSDESGWYILYQDPKDNRYWELSYPESEMQFGGAPQLSTISQAEAMSRYKI